MSGEQGALLPDLRGFLKELLSCFAVFLLVLAWSQRPLLSGGKVNAFQALPGKPQAVRSIYEMVYQEAPVLWTAAQIVRQGSFPSWTPFPEGGTPLLGKMQNGVFSPFHLQLYLMPRRLLGYALTLTPLLTAVFAFLFVWLFGRLAGLSAWSACAAGCAYVFAGPMLNSHALFADPATELFLPLQLALVELQLRYRRSWAAGLQALAFCLPFLAGHFETAARCGLDAAFYFAYRLWATPGLTGRQRLDHALAFAGAAACGAALSAVQILPGTDYLAWSYNRVWRSLPEYGWAYHTVQKFLGADDAPLLAGGLLCLWAAWALLRGAAQEGAGAAWTRPRLFKLLAAAAAAAAAVGALSVIGLDDTAGRILRYAPVVAGAWAAKLALLALAAFGGFSSRRGSALRALAWLTFGAVVVLLKVPGFSNLLLHVPMAGLFNNTIYTPEFDLGRVVLAAFALERAWALGRAELSQRRRVALTCWLALAAAVGAFALSRPLKDLLAVEVGASVGPATRADPSLGGMTTPGDYLLFPGAPLMTGWLSAAAPVTQAAVGPDPQRLTPVAWGIESGGRRYFSVRVPVREGDSGTMLLALSASDGRRGMLAGPQFETFSRPPWWGLALLGALPLVLLVPWSSAVVYAAAILLLAASQKPSVVPAADFPMRLAALDAVKADRSLFRVDSFEYSLLEADYPNLYGLQDIRGGGDNLDVLPMIYLQFLRQALLSRGDAPSTRAALVLDGLANVKYLFDLPGSKRAVPGLVPVSRDDALTVFRNDLARPRASFFEQATPLPLGDLRDFERTRQQIFAEVPQKLLQKGFDAARTLLVDRVPRLAGPAALAATSPTPAVRVASYRADAVDLDVDTPRAGYVMLADNMLPGWKAWLDGRPAEIARAWIAFRAVAVPAGRSRLRFAYRPAKVLGAAALSALAALLWAAWFWRLRRALPPWDAPAPAPVEPAAARAAAPEGKRRKQAAKARAAEKARAEPAAPPEPQDPGLAACCARAVEWLLGLLLVPWAVYWCAWGAFVLEGGLLARRGLGLALLANGACAAALLALGAAAVYELLARRRVRSEGRA